MKKRNLGKTGLTISPLGLGTVKFGRNEGVKYPDTFELPNEDILANLLSLAKDLGINLLDTAPAYGRSEERLGRLLKGQRKDWVIIGKAGEEFENGQSTYNFTPDHFERSLERSLKNLQTDYLDVFLIHSDGRDTEILTDDLIHKMQDFKDQGLVHAIGASTKTTAGGLKALELMDVVMATYTPDYQDEKPVLDYAAAHNKGVLLKKVLDSGHFSNVNPPHKRGPSETQPEDPRLRGEDTGEINPAGAALSFALAHPGVTSAIIGTINPDHLRENARAMSNL